MLIFLSCHVDTENRDSQDKKLLTETKKYFTETTNCWSWLRKLDQTWWKTVKSWPVWSQSRQVSHSQMLRPPKLPLAHTCKYIGISTPMQQSVCVWTFDQYQSPIEDEISSLWMRKNGCHFLSNCRVVNSQSTALYSRSLQVRCLVHFFKDHRNVFVY